MKQNRSLYIILALLTIINLGIGTATAIKEQSTVIELHDGDMAICICATATPESTETPENTATPEPEPTATNTPEPTSTATPTVTAMPTATPEPSAGKPFGPFNWVPDSDWSMFTASRLGRDLSHYEAARQHGVKVLAAWTGGHSGYTDANGCFSLEMYKNVFDRLNLTAFQPYIDDGTIALFYAMDEPHDYSCGPSFADLDAICQYVHEAAPGLKCGFNAPVSWMAQGAPYEHIDVLFTQTNFQRTSDWAAWAEQQFADAAWFDGDVWLSINAYTGSPTAAQIHDAAIALCKSQAAGVMIWKWGLPDFNSLPGMREAMEEAAAACGGTQ